MKSILDLINAENTAIILFFIGVYGLIARRNILKTIISIGIITTGIILLFVSIGFDESKLPPINIIGKNVADPIPQALMITAIIIGVSVTAVTLIMFNSLYHKYGTTNWLKVKKKRIGKD